MAEYQANAKSYGRSASHHEEWPVKHWQAEKAKRGVTDKFPKRGWWRLKPQRNFEVTSTELRWTGQEAGKNQAILTKGSNASCHQAPHDGM